MEELLRCTGFERDDANTTPLAERHGVSPAACEQVLLNRPLLTGTDEKHSQTEPRYYGLGQTDLGRLLFVVVTVRGDFLRIVTARDMSRRERRIYQNATQNE